VLHALANEVLGKPVMNVPNMQTSTKHLQQTITDYYQGLGTPVAPQSLDVMELAENLSSVIAPLYADMRATFSRLREGRPGKTSQIVRLSGRG
jgi:L-asparagine transporter-like permease